EAAVTNPDIKRINELLAELSPERVREVADFAAYLAERERRHKKFVEETLAAEQEEGYTFDSVEEAMEFIRNWRE
ncbi:MAG: hypothetical protein HQL01_12005, partial [Nitrospirae bacterium]|nr:hypothetical protein [Nitrospirota bacterium]